MDESRDLKDKESRMASLIEERTQQNVALLELQQCFSSGYTTGGRISGGQAGLEGVASIGGGQVQELRPPPLSQVMNGDLQGIPDMLGSGASGRYALQLSYVLH